MSAERKTLQRQKSSSGLYLSNQMLLGLRKTKGVETLVNKNEHLADSVAAIYTGLTTDQYQNAANMMRSFAS